MGVAILVAAIIIIVGIIIVTVIVLALKHCTHSADTDQRHGTPLDNIERGSISVNESIEPCIIIVFVSSNGVVVHAYTSSQSVKIQQELHANSCVYE